MAKTLTLTVCEKPPLVYDLVGHQFNKLTVIRFAGISPSSNKYWECQCVCGNTKIIAAKHFTTGKTQSCGCTQSAASRSRVLTHGESSSTGNTPEYRSYSHAKSRCLNSNNIGYPRYGGRGIEFRFNSFQQFLDEMGRKPTPSHSLDRIDNNGHYEKGNLRWATPLEQNRNTRKNKWLTANGITKCISEWCADLNLTYGAMIDRLKNGWCGECATSIKPMAGRCAHR